MVAEPGLGLLRRFGALTASLAAAWMLAAPAEAAFRPHEPLGHTGRWITDARGRAVIFHGVAVVPANEQVTPRSRGFSRDDARFLARQGFDLVRLGMFYRGWELHPGAFDRGYLRSYRRTRRTLAHARIFTLLDFHQDMLGPRYQGRGFPGWFLDDDGFPNQPRVGFPGNYLVNSALNRAYDNLWANVDARDGSGLQDHFAEGWRRVAKAFADRRRIAGYDLFNEPWPGSAWPTCANTAGCPPGGFDQVQLTDFFNRVIAALRQADSRHLAFYEPNLQFDVGAPTHLRKMDDPDVGLSFHNYCLGAAPGLPRVPDPAGLCRDVGERGVFRNAEAHSSETGAALLLTEFGDTTDAAIHRRMVDLADEFMVGWTMWAYLESSGNLIVDPAKAPRGDNIRRDVLAALVRAYPRIVAGTPQSFGFDRDERRFKLAYSTTLPDGSPAGHAKTEVFIPRLRYGNRYRVRLEGARVAGGLGTRSLRIRACPGADRVRVKVTDRSPRPTPRCRPGDRERSSSPG
jgi:endoglycosylceramidase